MVSHSHPPTSTYPPLTQPRPLTSPTVRLRQLPHARHHERRPPARRPNARLRQTHEHRLRRLRGISQSEAQGQERPRAGGQGRHGRDGGEAHDWDVYCSRRQYCFVLYGWATAKRSCGEVGCECAECWRCAGHDGAGAGYCEAGWEGCWVAGSGGGYGRAWVSGCWCGLSWWTTCWVSWERWAAAWVSACRFPAASWWSWIPTAWIPG